jgi:protein-disulfide isomerase
MKPKQQQLPIVIGVVVVVVVAVGAIIAASGSMGGTEVNFSAITQSRGEDGSFILGSADAPITIIEFADYACPHCIDYHPEMKRFIKEFVETGRARFEYRTFPTAGGEITDFAGRVGECAENQRAGAFWETYDMFYNLASTARFNQNAGQVVARELGLNYSDILDCTREAQGTRINIAYGSQAGVNGTPAVMMRIGDGPAQWVTYNGVTYNRGPVPFDVLAAVVNSYNS